MKELIYEPPKGWFLLPCIVNAIDFAKIGECVAVMQFNEIELKIHSDSRAEDIVTIYDLKHKFKTH